MPRLAWGIFFYPIRNDFLEKKEGNRVKNCTLKILVGYISPDRELNDPEIYSLLLKKFCCFWNERQDPGHVSCDQRKPGVAKFLA